MSCGVEVKRGETRRPKWDRSTPSVPFSHLKAWHHNNQTKPVLIHLVESRGHGHDLMKPISHSSHTLRETGGLRPVKIPQVLDKRISNKSMSPHREVDKTKGLCPILTKIEFWSNRSSPVGFSPHSVCLWHLGTYYVVITRWDSTVWIFCVGC